MSKKVAIYVSNCSLHIDLDDQIKICSRYAENLGYTIHKIYIDASSDPTSENHGGYAQLVKKSSSYEIEAVIIADLGCLSTNRYEAGICSYKLKKMGINLIPTTYTPENIMMLSIIEETLRHYSESILNNNNDNSNSTKEDI